jgi:hypothetical protein
MERKCEDEVNVILCAREHEKREEKKGRGRHKCNESDERAASNESGEWSLTTRRIFGL